MFFRKIKESELDIAKKIYFESFDEDVVSNVCYNKDNIYVVGEGSTIMGMCMIDYIDHILTGNCVAYLNDVCVDRKFRGMGVGTFMLNEVERVANSYGAFSIMLTSNEKRCSAINLYKNHGFEIYDTNIFKKDLKQKNE